MIEPGLIIVRLRRVDDPLAEPAPDRGQVAVQNPPGVGAEVADQVGLGGDELVPYIEDLFGPGGKDVAGQTQASSSVNMAVCFMRANSSRLMGEGGTSAVP